MKKQLIKLMFTVLTFGMLASMNAMATENEADSSIAIDTGNNILVTSEDAEQDGITAIQVSLKVKSTEKANVSFNFNEANSAKIADFRYHEDTNTLNVYMADSEPIFKSSDLLLGSVSATDTSGNSVDVKVTAVEESLKFVSQNNLTTKTFSFDGAETDETPETTDIPESTTGAVDTSETTTTTTTTANYSLSIEQKYPTDYNIIIPEGTEELEAGQNFTAYAENVLIEHGEKLELSVTSNNGWKLMDEKNPGNTYGIEYRMGYGDGKTRIEDKSAVILTVGEGKETADVKLTVLSVDDPQMAGKFSDTLTFKVEITR